MSRQINELLPLGCAKTPAYSIQLGVFGIEPAFPTIAMASFLRLACLVNHFVNVHAINCSLGCGPFLLVFVAM